VLEARPLGDRPVPDGHLAGEKQRDRLSESLSLSLSPKETVHSLSTISARLKAARAACPSTDN
jgi:hypothetical protein